MAKTETGEHIDAHNFPPAREHMIDDENDGNRAELIDENNVSSPVQTYDTVLVRTYPPTEWRRYRCWGKMKTRKKDPWGEVEAVTAEHRKTTTTTTATIAVTAYVTFASPYPILTLLIKFHATSYPHHHHLLLHNIFSQDHGRITSR